MTRRRARSFAPRAASASLILVCAGLLSALPTSGCKRITRIKQCRALIAEVNPALDEIETLVGVDGASPPVEARATKPSPVFGKLGLAFRARDAEPKPRKKPLTTAAAPAAAKPSASGAATDTTAAPPGPREVTSAEYRLAADRYERLAKQLGTMAFVTEDMVKSVAEYGGISSSAARSLRALAAALEAGNDAEVTKASGDLERLGPREHSLVLRMNGWCQPGNN